MKKHQLEWMYNLAEKSYRLERPKEPPEAVPLSGLVYNTPEVLRRKRVFMAVWGFPERLAYAAAVNSLAEGRTEP